MLKYTYNLVIENKTRHPAGILKWKEVIDINDEEIKFAFMFVNKCSLSTFDRAFQYKINTQILPTKEYLFRYRVAETNVCTRCNSEPDTVLHSLWSCPTVVPYVEGVLNYLRTNCQGGDILAITMKTYFFGTKSLSVNLVLLELKKQIFYNKDLRMSVDAFCELFFARIRKLMIKEKYIMMCNNKFNFYDEKWRVFLNIYNYYGPDHQIIS